MKKLKLFLVSPLLADVQSSQLSTGSNGGLFGSVSNPLPSYTSNSGEGLFTFLSNIFKLIGTVAGIYMVFQIIMAGYNYISAQGDAKKTEAAWNQIWQSILGLVIIASAFVIAGLVERFTGIKILNPVIYGPGS